MQFGFIGVGQMGGGLARNLIRAKKNVWVFDLNPEAVKTTLAAGTTGRAAAKIEELAGADVVFTSLPLPQHLESVMLGERAFSPRCEKAPPTSTSARSTPPPPASFPTRPKPRGSTSWNALSARPRRRPKRPKSPSSPAARKPSTRRCWTPCTIIGKPVYYLGEVEAACALKLISNLIGMTNLAVLTEGIRIGEKAGIEPKYLLELLNDTGAKSFQMDVRGPWIAGGDFKSRFGLDLALKDVRLGCEMAKAWGNDAKTMQVALDYLKAGSSAGYGKEDCNAMYKVIK